MVDGEGLQDPDEGDAETHPMSGAEDLAVLKYRAEQSDKRMERIEAKLDTLIVSTARLPTQAGLWPHTRNPGIDLVRGVSIILVVIHHTALRIPLAKTGLAAILPRRLLTGLSWDGYEAVFVFFVVSGFLIAGNALTRWGALARLDPRAFYARRAARILPCLLALLATLCLLHLLHTPNYVITGPDQSLPGALLAALTLHLNWYEGRTGWLPSGWDILWSLSIEEVFYLAFPLLCRVLRLCHLLLPLFGLLVGMMLEPPGRPARASRFC